MALEEEEERKQKDLCCVPVIDESLDEDDIYDDEMDTPEAIEYFKMLNESEGFDVDIEKCRNVELFCMILPCDLESQRKNLTYLVSYALQQHNEEKGTQLEFVSIITANEQAAAGYWYFITLEAKDVKEDQPKVYQLLVFQGLKDDDIKVAIFRLKSSPPPFSTPTFSDGDSSSGHGDN